VPGVLEGQVRGTREKERKKEFIAKRMYLGKQIGIIDK